MGGKKEQGARTPYEAPNSLSSAQVLRIIDAVAEGELAGFGHGDDAPLKSVFFNDTPVQNADNSFNFKGVEAFFVRGTPDQPYIPGFAATERTVAVGAAVKRNTPIVRAVSNVQTDRLRVTVGVERNLSVQENGDTVAAVTELVVELVGNRGVAAMQTVRFSEKSSGAYYQDVDFNALPPVPFNIHVRRNTPDSDSDRVVNNTFFASYVEITDIKLSYPYSALAALKIDSDQFGNQIPRRNYLLRGKLLQVPSNYNPETRQYTGLWDGSFKVAWSNNPVWVFYDLLTNPRYSTLARRLTAADVDKWALYEIAKYCDAPVPDGFGGTEPRFTCNAYITDARQAADVLSDLAAAFCALPVWDGSRLSLRADTAAEPVAQYSNANVVDGAFAYAGAALKAVHTAVHVRYADKHDGWRMKTEYVADDAAIARYGLNIKAVTAFGCDSRGQAVRFGEWLLQTELRQQDTVTFSVGREGLRHLPHDVIRIADNDYAGADIGGRVKAVAGNLITLDRTVSAAAGQILHYSAADGSLKTTRITAQTAPNTLRVESAAALAENAVWALAGAVKPRLYRALSVRENTEDGTYTITALRHDPDKYAAVDGSANFERSTLHGQAPEVSGGEVRGDSGALALTWSGGGADGDVLAYDIKIYRNGSLYRHIPDASSPEIRLENLPDGDYRAEIRARNARGVWSETLQKAWRISYAIEGLRTSGKTLAVDLTWNLPETVANSVQTELRYGSSNDFTASKPLATLPYPQNSYTLTGVAVTDTYYFWARLTDADGRSGEWTAAVVGRADTNPAPIVKQIQGAIEKSTLSQALINQLQADDTAAENRAKAAAAADAANKVAAEARARAEADRAEAQARATALQQETQARTTEIRREADKQAAALRTESGKLTTAIASAAQTARSELTAQVAQLNAKDGELKQAQTALDGKAAELSRTAQQLGNRITAAETVNREQATAIQTVTAAHGRTAAALEAEKTARAQGDAAEARAREALAATVGQNTAALSAERQARIDGAAANTRELMAAKSRIAEAVSSIGRLEQTVANHREAAARETRELTARMDNLQVGGRNYVLASDRSTANYLIFAVSPDLTVDKLRGQMLTVSCDIVCQGVTSGRLGAEARIDYADGTSAYVGAWRRTAGNFKGRISAAYTLADKPVNRIVSMGIYNQTGGGTATIARPKLEIGNVATDWSPAPEDGATAAEAAITAERAARAEADNALTRELNTAKSRLQTAEAALQTEARTRAEADRAEAAARQTLAGKVDGNTVALAEVREAKADKTQVGALAQQTLSAEWQRDIATAKAQAQQAAAQDAQAKAEAARQAAERASAADTQSKVAAAQAATAAEIRAAKEAAAADAQRKADAARTAAASAAETADRNVLQQAAREAQAKADAAKRAAETAASADATAKANAAKAQAIADAAAKDAVLKREAAADAQQKADAVRRIAEAAQRAADTVAADLVREQKTRAAGDEANAREITAATARLGTAESGINELRQTTARQNQALAEAQNSLTARIDGVAADATVGGNLVADGALKQAALWRSHYNHNIAAEFVSDIADGKFGAVGIRKTGSKAYWNYCKTNVLIDPARTYRFSAWLRKNAAQSGANYFTWWQIGKRNYGSRRISAALVANEWVYVEQTVRGADIGDSVVNVGFALSHNGGAADVVIELQNYRFEDVSDAVSTAAVAAELTAYKKAQASTDAAQTAELQAAKSQIGQQTAALEQVRSTKADKSEVSAQLQTTLQSAARDAQAKADAAQSAAARTAQIKADAARQAAERAAAEDAQSKVAAAQAATAAEIRAAKEAAAADAQHKADAAKAAAASAAETADRAILQQAAEAAQAKADAAKRAAETAASADATAKATAAEARAIADAAAKDAIVKREAAADASTKAETAKNAAIAEAQRLNTAANARINELQNTVATNREAAARETRELTARLDNLQVGGRNYVLASDRSTANYLIFAVSPDLTADKLRGQMLTVSCDIVCQGVTSGRIGAEARIDYADGTSAYVGAWRRTAGNFKGRISAAYTLADKPVNRIVSMGIYNQTGGGTATVARPKLEIGNVATDWSPAPEDGAAATEAAITTEREARTTADRTQTAEITAAKSQIGNNTAAIDGIRSTKADKTEVAALARTSLASEWTAAAQTAAQTAKTQAVQAAASDAQAKAAAAQRAAEQAAERLATAKANAAQAAAVAAASGDAQRKADTAKQAAIAEANRLNTATNARVNTLEQTVSTQNSATATQIRNLTATVEQNRVAAELAKASVDGNVLYIAAPEGASLAANGTSTGAIKIRLPVRKTSTMIKFRVEIFDYATEKAASYEIAGYNYGGGSWYHPTVVMSGAAANTKNVRFGHDDQKDCVWIGELNSTWSYLKVRVVDLVAGHQGHTAANWQRGWQISVVTAFDTVQHVRNTLNPAKDAAQALADIATERTARVEADNALTQQLNTAKSQINGQTAQISRLESTKADQSSVSAQLQTTLQAAARDAQSKADAAKTAAERTAQAKADAVRRLAEAARADITALQSTVANNHRAQSERVNTLSAKLDNLQIGGRNYVLASDRNTTNSLSFGVSPDLTVDSVRGQTLTVSCDIVCQGVRAGSKNRIGTEITVEYTDGSRTYVGAWRNNAHSTGDFAGRISATYTLADKPVRQIHALGIYNQTGGGTAMVARPKLEIGSVATDWSPAPEDVATAAQIQAVQNALAEKDRAQSERTAALTAKVGTAEATVRTAQTAVTALNGKVQAMHTLKVQAVGSRKAVAGIALGADGQTGDSQFVVMADKFALARPGGNTVQMPFVVTTVGGQAQLALAGDMLVDGLIQGKHIAAGQTIRTPTLVAAKLEIGSFTMQPSGAFTSRSTAPNQAGLSIDNDRIVIRDASGRVRIILGRLR